MMNLHFVTTCWTKHLPNVAVLANQLAKHYPESILWIGWIDQHVPVDLPANCRVVMVEDVFSSQWPLLISRYTQTELLQLSRPFYVRHILEQAEGVVFLAPESLILRRLTELTELSAPAGLLSQWLRPHPDHQFPDSKFNLNYGTYFSGCWFVRKNAVSNAFLNWWCQNLFERGGYNTCQGQASDQLWLDLAPAMFAGIVPLRNPDYGIHTGNAFERNGENAATFHFSGYEYHRQIFANFLTDRPIPTYFKQAAQQYARQVIEHPLYNQVHKIQPHYGLPDPPLPVSIHHQKLAEPIRKFTKWLYSYQPDFLNRR
ncbi:MAG: hypothetical protein QM669_11785 [Siphonobacter sp.]